MRFASDGPRRDNDGARRILYSGSLIPRKGVDLLAQAFSDVFARHPHLRLDVVGAGELEPQLRAVLQRLPAGTVKFHGFQPWERLPEFYHAADVLCVPSRYDGWGLVVPEGLAAGLPVIGTDRTGAALDLIQSGSNGWLTNAGSLASLTTALEEAATLTPAQLAQRSQAARLSVLNHSLQDGVRIWTDAALSTLGAWEQAA
jgi:glycosyltransferase involved in cell wall biosynthesis